MGKIGFKGLGRYPFSNISTENKQLKKLLTNIYDILLKRITMTLKLTTFPTTSIEEMDKIYILKECKMYIVECVMSIPEDEDYTSVRLNDGEEMFDIAMTGTILPTDGLVLIKDI